MKRTKDEEERPKMRDDDGLCGFRQLAEQYRAEAKALADRREFLVRELAGEWDIDRRKNLEERCELLETERYELLWSLRAIQSYIRERSR